jgi:hypothetical protein
VKGYNNTEWNRSAAAKFVSERPVCREVTTRDDEVRTEGTDLESSGYVNWAAADISVNRPVQVEQPTGVLVACRELAYADVAVRMHYVNDSLRVRSDLPGACRRSLEARRLRQQ